MIATGSCRFAYWKVVVLCLMWLWLIVAVAGQKTSLHFSYITTSRFVSSGGIPVVDLALEQINNRTDILPNHTLSYTTVLDSQCNETTALDAFMEHFRGVSQPTYFSLLCCGCSTATIPVAEVSHYWNIPQMAGISQDPILNNRQKFRGLFRTLPSLEFVGPALAEIARQFQWTQMAIVTQKESLFQQATESLESIFTSEGRTLDTTATIDLTVTQPFPYNLIFNWERDYRIIVINANPPIASAVLCEAFYRGFLSPKYAYLTLSWYSDQWWQEDYGNSSCTPAILQRVLNNSLAYTPYEQYQSVSGLTPKEFARLTNIDQYLETNFTEFILSGSLYDAMWAIAMGLHDTSDMLSRNDSSGCDHLYGELVPLEEFDYQNEKMGCILRKSFSQVHFYGITGALSFNSSGSRNERTIHLQQYNVSANGLLSRETVAEVQIENNGTTFIFLPGKTVQQLWPDGVPYDGAARIALHSNSIGLVIAYSIAACAGLVYTAAFFLLNVIWRRKSYFILSSHKLNHLIIIGAFVLYLTAILYQISAEDSLIQTIICNIRHWLFSLGYTLCFAVILAKAGRVCYVFVKPKRKKKRVKDLYLLIMVLLIVAVDLIILLIGTAIPASRLNATLVTDGQHPTRVDDEGITYNNQVFGVLHVVTILLAFFIRKVKIVVLNHSKEITVIFCINSVSLILLALVEFALNTYHELYAALFGLGLMVAATTFLSLVFIPMIVIMYKDPTIFPKAIESSSLKRQLANVAGPIENDRQSVKNIPMLDIVNLDEVADLKQRVFELEKRLAAVEKRDGEQIMNYSPIVIKFD